MKEITVTMDIPHLCKRKWMQGRLSPAFLHPFFITLISKEKERERIDDGTWIRRVSSSISPSFPKIVQIRGFHAARGSRKETDFIGFAGRRTRTAPAPGSPFLLHAAPWFAYENRFYWLCGKSGANRAGTRAAFSMPGGWLP